jgi:hypothetical protein
MWSSSKHFDKFSYVLWIISIFLSLKLKGRNTVFFSFIDLLIYCSCDGYIVTFIKVFTYILVRSTPFFLLYLLSFLEQFQQVSLFHFHTWIHSTSTILTFLHPFFMPSHWYQTPGQDLFYVPVLHLFLKDVVFLWWLYGEFHW